MHIRIISPAGHCDASVIDKGADTLRSWGHSVTISAHAKGTFGRYSGTPQDRIKDIVDALKDPDVDILYASRGGYGCMQLLDSIPVELIKEAGKPVFGYSDITALHALWQKADVCSVHAHMMKQLGETPESETVLAVKSILDQMQANKDASSAFDSSAVNLIAIKTGNFSNMNNTALSNIIGAEFCFPVIGGNLAVLSGLHGTPYDFDYAGKILFIEDIKESPYKIDRMMNQLRLGGVFSQIKALIIGQFTGCDEDPEMPKPLMETIADMLAPFKIPVYYNAPIGHVEQNFPVIEGLN